MAGLVPAIHFPESHQFLHRFWKMDGRHEGGHDDFGEWRPTLHYSKIALALTALECCGARTVRHGVVMRNIASFTDRPACTRWQKAALIPLKEERPAGFGHGRWGYLGT